LLATDLADTLVKRGVPFRKAHEIIGRVVRYCLLQKKRIQDLGDSELKLFSDRFPPGAARTLNPRSSVLGKRTIGGPSPANVAAQAAGLRKTAARLRKRLPKN
jgi:argininosuccinate lyase